ncbi:glycosyltransferase family 4 protein [Algoriphagus namhaensis]|uniref:Glycosyltransferase family 4 protein n=1 Tax=Algoriphagus namhaensis TaxID=915353 RepID=A0ABV8APX3_9BACT
MKVLLDLQYLNVATTGIKTYMLELANASSAYPHPDIEWIFTHDPDIQAQDSTYRFPKNKIQRLNYHLDYFRWKEFQLPDLVKKHQPDLLICPDFVSPAAALPCRRMTVIHDAFFWEMPQNYPVWWRKYFLNLVKKGLKEPTEIITTTEFSKRALQKHLKLNHPVTVIYQSQKTLGDAIDAEFLASQTLKKGEYFLHIGTFDKRKNLPVLVKAFAEMLKNTRSNFKLVLAGGAGQSVQMNDLPVVKKLVEELGLVEKVVLPGFVTDAQVKALYSAAFGYVFPSENEGFGIPVLEAMAEGVPVIHSDQPALVEVAGGAGLVTQTGDVADLSEKMILLSQDQILRDTLQKKGLERSKEFGPEKFIRAFQQRILSAAH